jgi:hypothetical protein
LLERVAPVIGKEPLNHAFKYVQMNLDRLKLNGGHTWIRTTDLVLIRDAL